ncbi:cardioacceleratory peptide receptor isoform X3 [Cephus cinctus]|uniref:Cardioacceleratory peptide receptor isoform X3 n=1 Tax=Cephus cinctus TaxID=211228 RepID=A0AAJ7RI71_CEPCN|nr:cardioacceleratory peptide receptor isoform X3 [Cephus cinctus]
MAQPEFIRAAENSSSDSNYLRRNFTLDEILATAGNETSGQESINSFYFYEAAVTYSSTYVLVALSIDRYDAITHPMNFSGSWFRARCLVAGAWCLSLLFATPNGLLFKERIVENKLQCWCHLNSQQWQIYISLVSVAVFILPALIISACYASIVFTIWSKSKLLAPSVSRPKINGHLDEDEDTRRASSRGLIPRAKIKTVKMTFVIVFVFILCWSPYIVFDLLQVFGHIPNTQTNIAIATFIQSLAPLNSAANPIIYCAFSSHICGNLRTFVNLFRKVPPFRWIIGGPRGGRYGNSRTDTTSLTEGISSRIRSLHVNTRSHSLHTMNNHKL